MAAQYCSDRACSPAFSLAAACKHCSGFRLANATLRQPGEPQALPGMTHTPCRSMSCFTTSTSSGQPASRWCLSLVHTGPLLHLQATVRAPDAAGRPSSPTPAEMGAGCGEAAHPAGAVPTGRLPRRPPRCRRRECPAATGRQSTHPCTQPALVRRRARSQDCCARVQAAAVCIAGGMCGIRAWVMHTPIPRGAPAGQDAGQLLLDPGASSLQRTQRDSLVQLRRADRDCVLHRRMRVLGRTAAAGVARSACKSAAQQHHLSRTTRATAAAAGCEGLPLALGAAVTAVRSSPSPGWLSTRPALAYPAYPGPEQPCCPWLTPQLRSTTCACQAGPLVCLEHKRCADPG